MKHIYFVIQNRETHHIQWLNSGMYWFVTVAQNGGAWCRLKLPTVVKMGARIRLGWLRSSMLFVWFCATGSWGEYAYIWTPTPFGAWAKPLWTYINTGSIYVMTVRAYSVFAPGLSIFRLNLSDHNWYRNPMRYGRKIVFSFATFSSERCRIATTTSTTHTPQSRRIKWRKLNSNEWQIHFKLHLRLRSCSRQPLEKLDWNECITLWCLLSILRDWYPTTMFIGNSQICKKTYFHRHLGMSRKKSLRSRHIHHIHIQYYTLVNALLNTPWCFTHWCFTHWNYWNCINSHDKWLVYAPMNTTDSFSKLVFARCVVSSAWRIWPQCRNQWMIQK